VPETQFMGHNEFVWFVGVCEDRDDPLKMGRIRVRALGIHTENLRSLPTEDLPWAYVMAPTTTPSMNGLGETPPFIVQGAWVIGFFKDGMDCQQPIILGTLPGVNTVAPNPTKGFNDPDGVYPITTGVDDVNGLARGATAEFHPALVLRRNKKQTGIPKSTKPHLPTVSQSLAEPEIRQTWDELDPKSKSGTLYPYNHVHESESGHIHEIDDTPGGERIHRQHRIGTYEEWHPNGARVLHTEHDNYEIISGDSNIFIRKRMKDDGITTEAGNLTLTVEGDVRQLIKGDYVLEVEGNYTEKIHKNHQVKVGAGEAGGNREEEIIGNHSLNINNAYYGTVGLAKEGPKDYQQTIGGNESRDVVGNVDIYTDANYTLFALIDMKLTTMVNFTATTVSGIMSMKSGTKLNVKSADAMHIKSETDLVENVGTFKVSTTGTTWNHTSQDLINVTATGGDVTIVGGPDIHLNP